MTGRGPRPTTTLVGPNRFVLALATGGLVALASAGTALLVVQGTSAVDPMIALTPPAPSAPSVARAPGVVVLPSGQAALLGGARPHHRRITVAPHTRVLARGPRPHPQPQAAARPQAQPQVPARPQLQLPVALPFFDAPGTSTAAALLRSGVPALAPQPDPTASLKQRRRAAAELAAATTQRHVDTRHGHRTRAAPPTDGASVAAESQREAAPVAGHGKDARKAHRKEARKDARKAHRTDGHKHRHPDGREEHGSDRHGED